MTSFLFVAKPVWLGILGLNVISTMSLLNSTLYLLRLPFPQFAFLPIVCKMGSMI
jgi:hypothetical protein